MRTSILRRLEFLEKIHRSRELQELSSFEDARTHIWTIVFAYYLGGLKPDERSPFEAEARALKYASQDEYSGDVSKVISDRNREALLRISDRHIDAYRRLFSKVGLDFDNTPRNVLCDALVTMVDQLPDQWSRLLRFNLRLSRADADIAIGSNVPRRLSGDNAFPFAEKPMRHESSTRKR
jgi:hypothetical protein